jgi:hypothetical protein
MKHRPLTGDKNKQKWRRRAEAMNKNPELAQKIRAHQKRHRATPKGHAGQLHQR